MAYYGGNFSAVYTEFKLGRSSSNKYNQPNPSAKQDLANIEGYTAALLKLPH
jgi:hypothetical protein